MPVGNWSGTAGPPVKWHGVFMVRRTSKAVITSTPSSSPFSRPGAAGENSFDHAHQQAKTVSIMHISVLFHYGATAQATFLLEWSLQPTPKRQPRSLVTQLRPGAPVGKRTYSV